MRPVLYYQELLRRQQVNYIDPHWPEKVLGTSKLCQLLLQSNETSVLTADSSSIAISSVPYLMVAISLFFRAFGFESAWARSSIPALPAHEIRGYFQLSGAYGPSSLGKMDRVNVSINTLSP
ncbi:hypothetical protein Salat_2978300 [Sesamum alatum]|uniref:Uncharacterized protein n=1 Tax=Sesamum alatum TaxID=300844 RepID=A0AAE2C7L0_9LAMI|nr:hypothetical protein Salat_2978300 [Sesamum alatum]